ncbi:MAG TPA: MerR family transcriptional regulator [Streptosporangiaceae bacterium]|jgi:DNA-binding transcriptional MerR regulator/effector-binding domain-containing protein
MAHSLPIGDFARATQLSIKTLRHYHRVGLLEPADVDQFTGRRRYTTDQIPAAQVIRRFRELDMPIEGIRGVLAAPDIAARNDLIAAHLSRLEEGLSRTRNAVAALRDLLDHPAGPADAEISHRSVAATRAAAISSVIDLDDIGPWFSGAIGELRATVGAPAGPPGGIYATDLFASERGQAMVFIPTGGPIRPVGRVEELVVPAAELAVIVHAGPHDGVDRAYGALATHVTQHALAIDGPIREYYLAGRHDTADEAAWRTEIGWPIFQTGGDQATSAATGPA